MIRRFSLTRCMMAGAVALSAALAAPAPALAEIELLEVFDSSGKRASTARIYDTHEALVITTDTAQSDQGEHRALSTWLEIAGAQTRLLTEASRTEGDESLLEEALDWISDNGRSSDTGLIVVIDSRTEFRDGELRLSGSAELDERPFDVEKLIEALDQSKANHVLVVFTTRVNRPPWEMSEVSRPEARPITEETRNAARQLLAPTRVTRGLMVKVLTDAVGSSPEGRIVFDPDSVITASDIARMDRNIGLFEFGSLHRGGDVVLATRETGERPFTLNVTNCRERYLRLRGRGTASEFRAFLDRCAEPSTWNRAARMELSRAEEDEQRQNFIACHNELTFRPAALLGMNLGVIGSLERFEGPRDLATAWTSAIRGAAVGAIDGRNYESSIRDVCEAAKIDAARAEDLALRMAMLENEDERISELLVPLADRDEAATLAGLRLLAEGEGQIGNLERRDEERLLKGLEDAAARQHEPAMLVLALHLLDGQLMNRDAERAVALMLRAAERSMPVAQALYGTLMLSDDRDIQRLVRGVDRDEDRGAYMVKRASAYNFRIDGDLVDLRRWEDRRAQDRVFACEESLASGGSAIDPHMLLGIDRVATLEALPALFGSPEGALKAALGGVDRRRVREACANIGAPSELPALLRLKLAMVEAADGRSSAALGLIEAGYASTGMSEFLGAMLLGSKNAKLTRELLEQSAAKGLRIAELALAVHEAHPTSSPAARLKGIERLRALAKRGSAYAQTALAVALVSDLPALFEKDRKAADAALLEARVWLGRARAQGFRVPRKLLTELDDELRAAAPRIVGLSLADLTPALRLVHMMDAALKGGVQTTAVVPGSAAAKADLGRMQGGDVILEVSTVGVSTIDEIEKQLADWLVQSAESGKQLTLKVVPFDGKDPQLRKLSPPLDIAGNIKLAAAAPQVATLRFTTTVYKAPVPGATIIGGFRPGTTVTILEVTGDRAWYKVSGEGREGYVPASAFDR